MRRESSKIVSSQPTIHQISLSLSTLDNAVAKTIKWRRKKGSGKCAAKWYNRDISPNR